jgi:hypothetical protein
LQWSIVRSGIFDPWPRSPGIWPWPGPLPEKYTFTSITRVPVVQIEQIRAHLNSCLAQELLWDQSPWSPATVAYSLIRPKTHISNIGHDGTLSFRNFVMLVKKFKNHNFEPILAYGHDLAKVPEFRNWAWWYSIGWKFHTDDKKSYQPTTKKCAPYFRGNTEFPIYLIFEARKRDF